jgi:hypothetical protein
MRGLAIRIGIIAVIIVGGLILRDRLSGSAGDLKVGECFDDPGTQVSVESVQHHPCSEAHSAEVIFVGDYPEASAYPGVDAFDTYAFNVCIPTFETYTGRDYQSDTELDIGYLYPTEEGWPKGDHEIACYVYRLDAGTMSTSVKAGS